MIPRIMVIPDTQVKPGVPIEHMRWAGLYAADKRPDIIIHLGDHWDMPSLCIYDRGKVGFEGRRVAADLAAGELAMDMFMEPIFSEIERRKYKKWAPQFHFLMGNHEHRLHRAIEKQPELDGLLDMDSYQLDPLWEVHDFLEVLTIEGVCFSHYFTSGVMGRPVSSANLLVKKKMQSCVMGHVQDRDIAEAKRADGTRLTGIFAGIFYQHDEEYLGPQQNNSWRGIWMLHNVHDGQFDYMPVSMDYLRRKYA